MSDQLVTFPASISMGIVELDIKESQLDLMLLSILW